MPQPHAFALAVIVALATAELIAVQMMQSFQTMDEFGIVAGAIAVQVALSTLALGLVLRSGRGEGALAWIVVGIALATWAFSGWPIWMDAVEARETSPYVGGDTEIALEFLLPCLAALTVLWRLLVRAYRRARALDARTNWPWFTIAIALTLVFNPLGLAILGPALAHEPSDWLWSLWAMISAATAAVLAVLAIIEYTLRARRFSLPVQAEA
jgi:hypothetical protein